MHASLVVHKCCSDPLQARANEESKTRSRLDKAERAIEQERAQSRALQDALQALQQVQRVLSKDGPHTEMTTLTVNKLTLYTHSYTAIRKTSTSVHRSAGYCSRDA